MKAVRRVLAVLLAGVIGAWLAYGALLWWLQDAMIFPAPGGVDRASLDAAAREIGARPVDLVASDGTRLYAWHRDAGGRRAVLYLHGNGSTVATSMALQRLAHQQGWDFATVAWRGYPGSEGSPSEAGLIRDARALWDHLVSEGIPPERIVIHGRSLGGGIATALATEVEPAAVVLESTFTSMIDMARLEAPLYPVELLLRSPIDTRSRAGRVEAPVLVLHGTDDTLVPVTHGRELATLFPEARFVEVPGRGHDDLLVVASREGREAWLELLEEVAPWPPRRADPPPDRAPAEVPAAP